MMASSNYQRIVDGLYDDYAEMYAPTSWDEMDDERYLARNYLTILRKMRQRERVTRAVATIALILSVVAMMAALLR